jgi:hypothetical protein
VLNKALWWDVAGLVGLVVVGVVGWWMPKPLPQIQAGAQLTPSQECLQTKEIAAQRCVLWSQTLLNGHRLECHLGLYPSAWAVQNLMSHHAKPEGSSLLDWGDGLAICKQYPLALDHQVQIRSVLEDLGADPDRATRLMPIYGRQAKTLGFRTQVLQSKDSLKQVWLCAEYLQLGAPQTLCISPMQPSQCAQWNQKLSGSLGKPEAWLFEEQTVWKRSKGSQLQSIDCLEHGAVLIIGPKNLDQQGRLIRELRQRMDWFGGSRWP